MYLSLNYSNGQMQKLGLCLTPLFGILTMVSSPEVTVSYHFYLSNTKGILHH